MKAYVLSFFNNGEREATDGVYGVYSTLAKAWQKMAKIMEDCDESFLDYDTEPNAQTIYTDKGTYLIETMDIDDDDAE